MAKQDPYAHRAYRSKHRRGYGAEGVANGKTEIGEMRPMQAPEAPGPICKGSEKSPSHTQGSSAKDKTSKQDDKQNAQEIRSNHKTKPNPY
jgi:hypothetical protein